jgi:hypothetical protein
MRDFSEAKLAKAIVENIGGAFVCHNRVTGLTSFFKPVGTGVRVATTERVI